MKLSRNGSPKDMDKLGKMRALFTVRRSMMRRRFGVLTAWLY